MSAALDPLAPEPPASFYETTHPPLVPHPYEDEP
jgi:hypothetical protein